MQPTPLREIDEELVEFNRARFKEEVSQGIFDLMVLNNVNRKSLADLLGVAKPRISHMLTGEQNFQIETLADVFLVLGGRGVHITLGAEPDELRIPLDEVTELPILALESTFHGQEEIVYEETNTSEEVWFSQSRDSGGIRPKTLGLAAAS